MLGGVSTGVRRCAFLTLGAPEPLIIIRKERVVAVRVVRLGSPRVANEGLRIGTVRRPPRGVPKAQFASQNWYDVWFPNLAPSVETMKLGQSAKTDAQWGKFTKKYRAEMATPENNHAIELLAALSRQCNFQSAATARTKHIAIVRCCANY
jgi:uncharacterized protein YeaO (DUF488 family)